MNIEPEHHAKNFSSHAVCLVSNYLSQAIPLPEWLKTVQAQPRGAAQASSLSRGHTALADSPHEVKGAPVLTLDTASLVTVVWTVVHLVTLLCSMDTGPIATLKFIWLAGHQSFKTTNSSISHTELSHLRGTYQP